MATTTTFLSALLHLFNSFFPDNAVSISSSSSFLIRALCVTDAEARVWTSAEAGFATISVAGAGDSGAEAAVAAVGRWGRRVVGGAAAVAAGAAFEGVAQSCDLK